MAKSGTLYLIPTTLGGGKAESVLPEATVRRVAAIRIFIVENQKNARRFLSEVGHPHALRNLHMQTLDEHTPAGALEALLEPLLSGHDCGLMSEAGCPTVADPGALLVRHAHERGIPVVPLVGPSSILLALMGAGLNGQRFAFHGYLPVERGERHRVLQRLERESREADRTQIFMEAPYRNDRMLRAILEACSDDTLLCLATDITLDSESIRTWPIERWRRSPPELQRRPTIFLLYSRRSVDVRPRTSAGRAAQKR